MREAARALDDVSDHLGEVLRRADDLLAEWSRFGAQVREQVEREAAAVGEVVDGAVGRAAATGIDRAIGDRLRVLTAELERIEQRARAASRAVVEQREADRRILWAVVAGIVLANALLVVLILRKPEAAPVAEPIRLEPAAAQPAAAPAPGATPDSAPGGLAGSGAAGATSPSPAAGSPGAASAGNAAVQPAAGQGANAGAAVPAGAAGSGAVAGQGAKAGPAGAAGSGAAAGSVAAGSGAPGGGARPAEAGPKASPVALPPRAGAPHPHKKLP